MPKPKVVPIYVSDNPSAHPDPVDADVGDVLVWICDSKKKFEIKFKPGSPTTPAGPHKSNHGCCAARVTGKGGGTPYKYTLTVQGKPPLDPDVIVW